jgi:hypothetical protein
MQVHLVECFDHGVADCEVSTDVVEVDAAPPRRRHGHLPARPERCPSCSRRLPSRSHPHAGYDMATRFMAPTVKRWTAPDRLGTYALCPVRPRVRSVEW